MTRTGSRAAVLALCFLLPAMAMCAGPEAAKKAAKDGGDVAAQVGSKKITVADLDENLKTTNAQAVQAYYDARRAALDQLIADQLLGEEAGARKITVDQLKQNIIGSAPAATDADAQDFFNKNKAQLGGRTLDQLKDQIKNYLSSQKKQQAMDSFISELKAKKGVKIFLEPPREDVKVTDKDPSKGSPNAPVQIVEFSDFQCPFCGRVEPTIKKIEDTYGDKIQFVFRDFPLNIHQNAHTAAEAANCAAEQGKFWEYHDKLFGNQHALSPDDLKKYAADLGLKTDQFNTCFDSKKYDADISQDMAEGTKLGVSGTPAFFINGRFISGAQPFETFRGIIDEELEMKGVTPPGT